MVFSFWVGFLILGMIGINWGFYWGFWIDLGF
jgi:hypothetical protein